MRFASTLLQSLTEVADEGEEMLEILKEMNLKVVYWTAHAWDEI
jgi:hypothetical protein